MGEATAMQRRLPARREVMKYVYAFTAYRLRAPVSRVLNPPKQKRSTDGLRDAPAGEVLPPLLLPLSLGVFLALYHHAPYL